MNTRYLKFKFFILCLFLVVPRFAGAAAAEKIVSVSAFTIESEEKLEFLEKGIAHMLESRLKVPGHSSVVFASDPSSSKTAKADYILEGTLLVFGDSVSTDARLINADSGKVELAFSQFGKEKGEVLNHIDLFAERIRTQVLHLAPTRGVSQNAQLQAGGPYVAPQKPVFWRSGVFEFEINSIAVADIDKDSNNETLVLSKNRVQVFRRTKESFQKLAEISLSSVNTRYLFIDVIDIDRDGSQEIFITGINDDTLRANSCLYRWEKSSLVKVADNLPWILRAVDTRDKGRLLLGQTTRGDDETKLKTVVHQLKMDQSGRLSPGQLSFPFADNALGMAFGDFLNNGQETIALLDLNGNLLFYSPQGKLLYKNSDEYGGSNAYLEYKGMRYNKDDGYQKGRIYLQQRIFAADLSNSGKISLLAVKNNDTTKGLLSKARYFDSGYLESLLSNEMGMTIEGRTQKVSGYICDYTIADFDNDGKKEILFAVVNSKDLFQTKVSRIMSQSFIVKGITNPF